MLYLITNDKGRIKMDLKKIDQLLHELHFGTSYQGYPTTVYLIGQAVEYMNLIPRPTLRKLCRITGDYFHIKPTQVSENLKTMLNNYCNKEENLQHFYEITGYLPDKKLTNKEFIYEVAAYLKRQG